MDRLIDKLEEYQYKELEQINSVQEFCALLLEKHDVLCLERKEQEKRRAAEALQQIEKAELQQYLRLKEKYEGKA